MNNFLKSLAMGAIVLTTTQQAQATETSKSAIHETFEASPIQDTIENPNPIYEDGEIRNGLAYFPSLGFALSLKAKEVTSDKPPVNMTTEQFDAMIAIVGEEKMVELLGRSNNQYLLRNTETGLFEYRQISVVDGVYTGETEEKNGELFAVYKKNEPQDIQIRSYPVSELSKGSHKDHFAHVLELLPLDAKKSIPTF